MSKNIQKSSTKYIILLKSNIDWKSMRDIFLGIKWNKSFYRVVYRVEILETCNSAGCRKRTHRWDPTSGKMKVTKRCWKDRYLSAVLITRLAKNSSNYRTKDLWLWLLLQRWWGGKHGTRGTKTAKVAAGHLFITANSDKK